MNGGFATQQVNTPPAGGRGFYLKVHSMPSNVRLSVFLVFSALAFLSGCGGGGGGDGAVDAPGVLPDQTPPVITLRGSSSTNHEQGTNYVDQGATATDAVDGPVAVVTTGSVGGAAGTYTITYAATDAAGNTARATRTVIVADTTAPVVILVGPAIVNHEQGSPFIDPGASATDVVDGSLAVITTGSVGTAVGTYTLTYTATDEVGNSASVSRTVIVRAPSNGDYTITAYGAGSISDTINPASYRCVVDNGNWIYNAGVVKPAIQGCNATTGIPTGTPTPILPQLTGPAANNPTPTHKWWGSIPFLGEMSIGNPADPAHITPDPIIARITTRGARVMGIPSGLTASANGFGYPIPDPFAEVFDGIAIGNTNFASMQAYLKDHSDGSVTVEWQSGGQAVMEATFVYGSPYAYFKAHAGELVVRTLRANGGEKGTFYDQGDSLGVWTSVSGNRNNFLVTGEGSTTFGNPTSNEIVVSNASKELTLTYLPETAGTPSASVTSFFESRARAVVAAVDIDYSVDRSNNSVTVSHIYRDRQGAPIQTIAGLQPLQWKNSAQATTGVQVRSARGTIKFSQTDRFDYQLPFIGVLPALPSINGTFDPVRLKNLVSEFVSQGPAAWNDRTDTYWAGKNYGKVAELIAIADSIGMTAEAAQLLTWLKSELADWFTAETNGSLDVKKYFVYDDEWNTLLGLEESFAAHQQLNDHHFHYGYFVRAATEICRMDISWCGADQYGPMIELLIRDYAAEAGDPMFPYMRNFDPANGFSWASGPANFLRGNNNESTSEAATAYGAIVLFGLVTGREDLVERGMYLHASTTAAYWEYWNNIDGYNSVGATEDNFPAGYNRITTSIIWGEGATFSTWFSGAFAHILGIQGLPSNPLILHVGQYADYMADYVALGLSQSSNLKPSGLPDDQWRDLWWNLWAMTDPEAALADYNSVGDYLPEAGETKAHTYHWIHTFRRLGQLRSGTGSLSSDHPAALAFEKNGVVSYVVYNFTGQALPVTFSDGHTVNATPYGFTVTTN
jgi:endo-1,3(4)-beta-glucanase